MDGLQLLQLQLHQSSQSWASNCQGPICSWGQIVYLIKFGTQTLLSQRNFTSKNFFMTMFTLITIQLLCLLPCTYAQKPYWAYVHDPPLLHPATWNFKEIKVVSDDSQLMGGEG